MKKYSDTVLSRAKTFLNDEKQFHLGFLPTEQAHPQTEHLDELFRQDIQSGVRNLQSVDANIVEMADRVFASPQYAKLRASIAKAISSGHHVVFSGCGATGRLSIMLEAMWRKACQAAGQKKWEDAVWSIMTGGDYALVRAVEFFEDYEEIGRQQVREVGMGPGDVLVAITEGGETSSVLGTVDQALLNGADVFLMFNNPASILAERIERSRKAIENPAVTVLDLFCGPMAVAGSTRMQATTSELLIAGKALEDALCDLQGKKTRPSEFAALLNSLASTPCVRAMAEIITREETIYNAGGLVTYFADELLLDIFTDTTERTPTFALPPFLKTDDVDNPPSWAFVKNPQYNTLSTWFRVLGREPHCLEWNSPLYHALGVSAEIIRNPPSISKQELFKYAIGNEFDKSRFRSPSLVATVRMAEEKLAVTVAPYDSAVDIVIGQMGAHDKAGDVNVPVEIPASPLGLYQRLAVKLVLNTTSTGTMVRLGRVKGNWMTHVQATNKKLIDRAIRLISGLGALSYEQACTELFQSLEELQTWDLSNGERPSPVAYSCRRLKIPLN